MDIDYLTECISFFSPRPRLRIVIRCIIFLLRSALFCRFFQIVLGKTLALEIYIQSVI